MAIVIPYVKQTWIDGNPANSASAARFGVLEEGILDVSQAPAVHVTHSTTQSVTSATPLTLAFNTERFDQAGGVASTQHDTVTNNSRLTCLYAGIYLVTANIEWAANVTGYRRLAIIHSSGANLADVIMMAVTTAAVPTRQYVGVLTSLAVNEYVTVTVDQNSGGALNVTSTANNSPEFSMVRVG